MLGHMKVSGLGLLPMYVFLRFYGGSAVRGRGGCLISLAAVGRPGVVGPSLFPAAYGALAGSRGLTCCLQIRCGFCVPWTPLSAQAGTGSFSHGTGWPQAGWLVAVLPVPPGRVQMIGWTGRPGSGRAPSRLTLTGFGTSIFPGYVVFPQASVL
jgi:hypothetical protein